MRQICDKDRCTGCSACSSICPVEAIEFKPYYGFYYPEISTAKCINCKKCISVCPVHNQVSKNSIINDKVIVAYNKDKVIRDSSSSGGVFYSLAHEIIDHGGVVYGAAWVNGLVKHIRITNIEDIALLQGSKYLQSNLSDVFRLVREDLKNGKIVLFSGVACQIAGLTNCVGTKKLGKLYLCEVLCHGAASPCVFKEHIRSIENKNNSKIISINFRYKTEDRCQNLEYVFQNGTTVLFRNPLEDMFYKGFLNGTLLRANCFSCQYVGKERCADITLGDFWGLNYSEVKIKKPDELSYPSLVLVNSEKGTYLWEKVENNFYIDQRPFNEAFWGNLCFRRPLPHNKYHDRFFSVFEREGYKMACDKYLEKQYSLKDTIKKVLGKNLTGKIIRILKR